MGPGLSEHCYGVADHLQESDDKRFNASREKYNRYIRICSDWYYFDNEKFYVDKIYNLLQGVSKRITH